MAKVPNIPFEKVQRRIMRHADPFKFNPHQAIFAGSRGGKSYMIRHGILPIYGMSRIVVMDVKPGGERTWNGYGNQVTSLEPGFGIGPDGTPHYHLLVKNREGAKKFLEMISEEGACIVVIDDSRRITGQDPDWNLSARVDGLMSLGAAIGITVIICANSTVWATSGVKDQTRISWIGQITNEDERKKILRYTGNDKELSSVIASLAPRAFLYSDSFDGNNLLAITSIPEQERA